MSKNPLRITDTTLRDAHQSLLATRWRIDDMLPIASEIDEIGSNSVEMWGGATFDSCMRFLGENPWERLRKLKAAMPRTPFQMLLRGQNVVGYRHYADDVVERLPGPAGIMLRAGVEHLADPKDLIEEVMFEKLLAVRTRLQRGLAFIAVSAASAPLLGLLGTVTGMISVFQVLAVSGSGNVRAMAAGVSQATVPTMAGMVGALSGVLFVTILSRRAAREVEFLEDSLTMDH